MLGGSIPLRSRYPVALISVLFAAITFLLLSDVRSWGFFVGHGTVEVARPPRPLQIQCEIWPGWRMNITSRGVVDDASIPSPRLGTIEVMGGATNGTCVPASARLGPFGHSSRGANFKDMPWDTVHWGRLQSDCAARHYASDAPDSSTASRKLQRVDLEVDERLDSPRFDGLTTGRTAVVLRTWDAFHYSENQMAWMRAMVTELALDTGGEYQLFILVDVKDPTLNLSDESVYAEQLSKSVPPEFQDVALLFNENLLREWFPKVGEHGAQDQMYQALQIFSYTFPEFDYVWQVEMDARFTGNIADMLRSTAQWAEKQPRKNLWERNARFFIPGLWNNNYTAFAAGVDEEFADGQGIWGPHPHASFYVDPAGPTPPDRSMTDWGVGEAADLINFAPLIDPAGSGWTYEHTIHGFNNAENLPRRMAIISMTRTSRKLLRLISREQRATGAWVVSESTPETWSLLHGLKAVYAPHLLYFYSKDNPMTTEQLSAMVHKGPRWNLAGGEAPSLVWGPKFYLGDQHWLTASYFFWAGDAPRTWWAYTNGTCAPPLLLHPVKFD